MILGKWDSTHSTGLFCVFAVVDILDIFKRRLRFTSSKSDWTDWNHQLYALFCRQWKVALFAFLHRASIFTLLAQNSLYCCSLLPCLHILFLLYTVKTLCMFLCVLFFSFLLFDISSVISFASYTNWNKHQCTLNSSNDIRHMKIQHIQ